MEILIGVAAVIVLFIIIILIGYVKAPPDTAYMISGFRKPRILIGKAGIRIPFLERLDKLSLKMFSVDVKTTDYVPNAEYINVKVDATVKIRIGQSEEMMSLASKFFLNEGEDMIIRRVQENASPDLKKMILWKVICVKSLGRCVWKKWLQTAKLSVNAFRKMLSLT